MMDENKLCDFTEEEYEYICLDCDHGIMVDLQGNPLLQLLKSPSPRCWACGSENVKLFKWGDAVDDEGRAIRRGTPVEH